MSTLYAQCTIALPLTAAERAHNRTCPEGEDTFSQDYVQAGAALEPWDLERLRERIIAGGEETDVTHLEVLTSAGAIADTPPPLRGVEVPADGTVTVVSVDGGETAEAAVEVPADGTVGGGMTRTIDTLSDPWFFQRDKRASTALANDYTIFPHPRGIRHATRLLGMDRHTAVETAFASMETRAHSTEGVQFLGPRCRRCGAPATHVTVRIWGRDRRIRYWFCDEHKTQKARPMKESDW